MPEFLNHASPITSQVQATTWSEIGLRKRQAREALIPSAWRINVEEYASRSNILDVPLTCGILSQNELHITSHFDAVDLIENIRSGNFSAEEVTIAFCKRAAIVQQLVSRRLLHNSCFETLY